MSDRPTYEGFCASCGEAFYSLKPTQKTCSKRCGALLRHRRPPRSCPGCGVLFIPVGRAVVYCSLSCLNESRRAQVESFTRDKVKAAEERKEHHRRWLVTRRFLQEEYARQIRQTYSAIVDPRLLALLREQDDDRRSRTVRASRTVSLEAYESVQEVGGRPSYLIEWSDPTYEAVVRRMGIAEWFGESA